MGAGYHGGFGDTHGNREKHKEYIENTLPKSSMIKIPSSAIIKEEQKNGYEQEKYTWKNARPAKHVMLVGKNKWVPKKRMAGSY